MRHAGSTPVRRGRLAAVLAGGAAVCLAGGAYLLTQPARADVADVGSVPADAPAGAAATVPSGAAPEAALPRLPARSARPTTRPRSAAPLPPLVLPPVAFEAPSLHARARVVPVGTDARGALNLPENPGTLGWWVGGALPGAARGSVVVAGHIDTETAGAGVMAAVVRLPLGAKVTLRDAAGAAHTYRVAAIRSYPKTALPASVFTGAGEARLVLVTCGGAFDAAAHHYSDNIVVYAVPVRS